MAGATRGEAAVEIAAAPARVYDLVSDITRMGEWSPECRRCEWVEPGKTFRGHNQVGLFKWSTEANVVAADPGREFAFTTVVKGRESTRWRYRIEPQGDRSRLTESYEFVWAPRHLVIADVLMRRDQQLDRGMRKTLARIKAAAEV
jgi:hypothetical protein